MNLVVEDIGRVVNAMRDLESETPDVPFYMYGHRLEIANRLLLKDKDKDEKNRKYPLIALRLDIAERVEGDMLHYRLNLAILAFTKMNYNAEQRYEFVFKPILYPLYEGFLNALKTAHIFTWPSQYREPKHTKIDRPYYGVSELERNVKHIFNDPLDGIEIVDLEISKRKKNC